MMAVPMIPTAPMIVTMTVITAAIVTMTIVPSTVIPSAIIIGIRTHNYWRRSHYNR
jgi:hypothetical protein